MKKDGWTAEQKRAFSKLTRLLISGQDFQHALSAATFLLEEVSEGGRYRLEEMRRFRCYETTMVVAYARPFSMAKGEVGRFSFGDAGVRLSPPEKRLHEKVVKHRNTLYAHSDAELVEMKTYLMHIRSSSSEAKLLMPRFEERMRFSLLEVSEIENLTRRLALSTRTKVWELGKDFEEEFQKLNFDLDDHAGPRLWGDGS